MYTQISANSLIMKGIQTQITHPPPVLPGGAGPKSITNEGAPDLASEIGVSQSLKMPARTTKATLFAPSAKKKRQRRAVIPARPIGPGTLSVCITKG